MEEQKGQDWKDFFYLIRTSDLPWGIYITGIITAFLSVTLTLGLPLVTQRILEGEIFNSKLIIQYVWLTIATTLLSSFAALFRYISSPIARRNIQRGIWPKLMRMPMRKYQEQNPRNLISRVTSDPSFVNAAIDEVTTVLTATYSLAGSFIIMWGMNAKLTLALLPIIPYIWIVSTVVGHFTQKTQYRVQDRLSLLTGYFAERLPKIRLIKSFGKEKYEMQRAEKVIEEQYEAEKKRAFVDLYGQPLLQSIRALIIGIVLIYGGILVGQKELRVSQVITFYMYAQLIHNNVLQYGLFWQTVKQARGASAKIADIKEVEEEPVVRRRSFEEVVVKNGGNITFENVSFSYTDKVILSTLNMTFEEGKVTGLVGPSGGGKSTVFGLLERLYQPNAGRILMGGVPIEDINLDEWRRSIVSVSQNSMLLSGTIRDNILYGVRREVSEEEIWYIAELAAAADFIRDFPEGMDKEVGEAGHKLSGGQRQRIAIARAFMLNPDFLLLDEATASLDSKSEHLVNQALKELMKGRTTILISHDLRNLRNADHLIIIENGTVTGSGSHKELMKENQLYADLVSIQQRKAEQLTPSPT